MIIKIIIIHCLYVYTVYHCIALFKRPQELCIEETTTNIKYRHPYILYLPHQNRLQIIKKGFK